MSICKVFVSLRQKRSGLRLSNPPPGDRLMRACIKGASVQNSFDSAELRRAHETAGPDSLLIECGHRSKWHPALPSGAHTKPDPSTFMNGATRPDTVAGAA